MMTTGLYILFSNYSGHIYLDLFNSAEVFKRLLVLLCVVCFLADMEGQSEWSSWWSETEQNYIMMHLCSERLTEGKGDESSKDEFAAAVPHGDYRQCKIVQEGKIRGCWEGGWRPQGRFRFPGQLRAAMELGFSGLPKWKLVCLDSSLATVVYINMSK